MTAELPGQPVRKPDQDPRQFVETVGPVKTLTECEARDVLRADVGGNSRP